MAGCEGRQHVHAEDCRPTERGVANFKVERVPGRRGWKCSICDMFEPDDTTEADLGTHDICDSSWCCGTRTLVMI